MSTKKPSPLDYEKNVIKKDSQAAEQLAASTSETWNNHPAIDTIRTGRHGLRVVRTPEYYTYLHAAHGDPETTSPTKYGYSLVERLAEDAKRRGAEPVALANYIVWDGDENKNTIEQLQDGLITGAGTYKVGVIDGEDAVHLERAAKTSISGAMISISRSPLNWNEAIQLSSDLPIALFADGAGTKPYGYELEGTVIDRAEKDVAAMVWDDVGKKGGILAATQLLVEIQGPGPWHQLFSEDQLRTIQRLGGGSLRHSYIRRPGAINNGLSWGFDLGAVAAAWIPEQYLDAPPTSQAGDTLIALSHHNPNPRCNGLGKRWDVFERILEEAVIAEGVDHWSKTRRGKQFLHYITQPSAILYPVFRDVLQKGKASAVYHNSGGSFRDKLSKPLIEQGLRAELHDVPRPNPEDVEMMEYGGLTAQQGYGMWPNGVDGFITTSNPFAVMNNPIIRTTLNPRMIATLEKSDDPGVMFRAYDGSFVDFRKSTLEKES